ncbi:MAG TPA: hypothetical protein GX507_07020 [Clostridia bacterium]|nr:hypothetical protein [Clostridia bacterium]
MTTLTVTEETLIRELALAKIVMLVGAPDTGKTTLATRIANYYLARGQKVAVVDADVGQSDIGPPGTVGMGILAKPIGHIRETPLDAFYFVGSLSPAGQIMRSVIGTRLMVDEALRLGAQKVIVDTTGLVSTPIGTTLKEAKVEAVRPDLLVALERSDELRPLLESFKGLGYNVITQRALKDVRLRNAEERQEYRRQMFSRYFRDTHVLEVRLFSEPPCALMKRCCHVPGQPLSRPVLLELAERLGVTLLWGEKTPFHAFLIASEHLDEKQLSLAALSLGVRRVQSKSASNLVGCAIGIVGVDKLKTKQEPAKHLAVGYIEGFLENDMKILLRVPQTVMDQGQIKVLLLGDYKIAL